MKKYFCLILFFFSAGTAVYAQQLNLSKGDQYTITTGMSASTAMKRGDKQVDMISTSTITKLYQVTDASTDGYQLSITTKKITDTLSAFGNQLAYSSERAADPQSQIEVSLSQLINDTYALGLDKTGKITKVDDPAKASLHKEVTGNSGIYHKELAEGQFLNFGFSIQLPANRQKGTTWDTKDNTSKNTFTVSEMDEKTTTVSYTSEIRQTGENTNLNGVAVIDNGTGVVLQRMVKVSSTRNIRSGDKSYISARNYTVVETCNKVN
jgi:hypothetical protein